MASEGAARRRHHTTVAPPGAARACVALPKAAQGLAALPKATRASFGRGSLWIGCLLATLLVAEGALGQTISGVVRATAGGQPIVGIDIDILDDLFDPVVGVNAVTATDGSYSIGPLDPGDYYVRADPSVQQGYVDQHYPGVFLIGSASLVTVPSVGNVTGIDFSLEPGAVLRGHVVSSDTSLPLAGMDLDLYAADFSFVSSIDATTDATGGFQLGQVPPGDWFIKVDPTTAQGYGRQYYNGAAILALATAINVSSTADVIGLDFILQPAGAIQGVISSADTALPVEDIDIDVFDAGGFLVASLNARSDIDGSYGLLSVPLGSYYLLADPDPSQPYMNTWYGSSLDLAGAQLIEVTKGITTSGIDIALAAARFIEGYIRAAGGGAPLADIDLDLLDLSGQRVVGVDALTLSDGSYRLGPMPSGQYLVRADANPAQGLVDQYHPGVFLMSQALPVSVALDSATGIDFTLSMGGSIAGMIIDDGMGLPLAGIDLDVFALDGEPIPSVDADTAADGSYTFAGLPGGSFLVRADPDIATGLAVQYYAGAADIGAATPILVTTSSTTSGINFVLQPPPPTGASPIGSAGQRVSLGPAHPNPFGGSTTLMLRVGAATLVDVGVYDVRGRRVRRLSLRGGEGERALRWDSRDDQGRRLSAGVYFMRVTSPAGSATRKLLVVR